MKKAEIEKLLKSYELGQTSSKEEADLRTKLSESDSGSEMWFRYLKFRNKSAPESLEQEIWLSIQSKEKKKKRVLYRAMAAAATVALLISLFLIPNTMPDKEMSYKDKIAVLDEALAMTSPELDVISRRVLYEDDIIIIYNETKKQKK